MSALNEFISKVRSEGLMVTNRYSVNFKEPPIIQSFPRLQEIFLYCESLSLPGLNISTQPAKTFGETREMPYEKLFETIQMTFLVDNGMRVKMLFDEWISNGIQNKNTRKFNYYKEYTTQIDINVLDKNEQQRYKVSLYECYPKNLTSVQMDNTAKGEPMRIIVTFQYKYWISAIMDPIETNESANQYTNGQEVPDTYYTDFYAFQTGFNSFENARNSLYSAESQTTGLGTIAV